MIQFTIGADPELFVQDVDKRFISAHEFIPGTKDKPHPVECGAIQKDGVSAEFNIWPASDCNTFVKHIKVVTEQMHDYLPKGCSLAPTPTAWFDKEYFDSLPDEPKMLGCTPDYNAYTGAVNDPPETRESFRTGSGHIHIGFGDIDPYDDDDLVICRNVVKQLDQALYYPSLTWDSDKTRRTLYGKMGAFRPRTYGVEYRPLSNAYLRDDALIRFVYERTIWAVDLLFNKGVKLFDAPELPKEFR